MNRYFSRTLAAICLFLSSCLTFAHASTLVKADIERMVDYFYIVGEAQADLPVYPLFMKDPANPEAKPELKAYVFETVDFAPSRGYSGKPINLLIIMDLAGNFLRVRLLDHKEPLFLDSAGTLKLERFASQYKGLSPRHNVEIGPYNDPGLRDEQIATVKGVQQGTISVKAINRAIMNAAAAVVTAKLRNGADEQAAYTPPKESKENREVKTQAQAQTPAPASATSSSPSSDESKQAAAAARPAPGSASAVSTAATTDGANSSKEARTTAQADKNPEADNARAALEKISDALSGESAITEAQLPAARAEEAAPLSRAAAAEPSEWQAWMEAWYERRAHIAILLTGLAVLSVALIAQKRLSASSLRLRRLRTLYLLFTVGFIGWTAQGQLTIANVTAALDSLGSGSDLGFLMNDPMTVILWLFTGITLLIWGRSTFCGWLCPFGALQELISLLTHAAGLKRRRLRTALDAKLKWIKYLILATLLVSLYVAPPLAELATEIEPFKTAISLYFMRDWPYVLWAAFCLLLSVFVYRGYCRYICPLGAALASVNLLQRWSWIPRRDACGTPCQSCRHRCEYQAIEPSGKINYSECFQCLDCVSLYQDSQRCFPLIRLHKESRNASAAQIGSIGSIGSTESI